MARVSILKSPDELTGEARRIAERIVDTRKSLEGPFSVWMHAPEWAERVAHLGTLVRWEGTLELRLRTLAALVMQISCMVRLGTPHAWCWPKLVLSDFQSFMFRIRR